MAASIDSVRLCMGCCLRGLLWANTYVKRERKRELWPDGSITLSNSFRGMLWQPELPPWEGSRSLKIRRKDKGTKITSPLLNTMHQHRQIGAVRTWP